MTPIMVKCLMALSLLLVTLEELSAQKEILNPEGCGVSSYKTMIVNGTKVKDTQYPWVVYLDTYFPTIKLYCGGTIITKRHVLTAAHCLMNKAYVYVQKVIVSYGSVHRRHGTKVDATKMFIHKGFDYVNGVNDIALLEVKYPFPFGKAVAPICLPLAPSPIAYKDAIAAGWGSLYLGGRGKDFLRHTTSTIFPDTICARIYTRYVGGLQCCARKRGKGICKGDSGGPLMIRTGVGRYQQVGVTSYVYGICGGDYPDVYTLVSGHTNWLTRGVSSSAGYMPLHTGNAYTLESGPFFIA
uniref:Putative tick serine protease n=1 Tax=Rhipicephalus pulchellus TaxID=72859 RepID=L7M9I4_RHIPC